MSKKILVATGSVLLLALIVAGVYAAWYTYHRNEIIAQTTGCNRQLTHPEDAPKMRAPDGTMVPVMMPCLLAPVPPTLGELVRGHTAPSDVPARMQLNPYTFWDALLGHYSASPNIAVPCDQSATTTDCSTLPAPSQPEPQPYVPPNPVQPVATWTSATGTPISLFGFSFELPVGWRGSVYSSAYTGSVHALVQSDSNDRGFTIDCPPDGKGLEAATRLSSKTRSFTADGTDYSVALEKWTAPGNDPWYFVWVRMPQSGGSSTDSSGTYCLAQGSATPDIEEAVRTMYESLK